MATNMTLLIPEILSLVSSQKEEATRLELLRKHRSPSLLLLFQYIFHPDAKFSVTEIPDYRKDPGRVGMSLSSLFHETRRLYLFLEKSNHITEIKKSRLLIQLLESLHPSEAQLVEKILLKKFNVKGITYELVNKAFPGLLPAKAA